MRVIQVSKVVDRIDLGELEQIEETYYSNSKSEENDSDTEVIHEFAHIGKVTEYSLGRIEELYEACIKSKYTRIVSLKKMTVKTRKLQEVHAHLWGPHKSTFISGKNYMAVLLNKFTRKSRILILRNKNEFFDIFKLWLPRAKVSGSRLDCLQNDGGGKFINAILQSFC